MQKKLSKNEFKVLNDILTNVLTAMQYDIEMDRYIDNGRFVQSLTLSQMNDLIECFKKINNQ